MNDELDFSVYSSQGTSSSLQSPLSDNSLAATTSAGVHKQGSIRENDVGKYIRITPLVDNGKGIFPNGSNVYGRNTDIKFFIRLEINIARLFGISKISASNLTSIKRQLAYVSVDLFFIGNSMTFGCIGSEDGERVNIKKLGENSKMVIELTNETPIDTMTGIVTIDIYPSNEYKNVMENVDINASIITYEKPVSISSTISEDTISDGCNPLLDYKGSVDVNLSKGVNHFFFNDMNFAKEKLGLSIGHTYSSNRINDEYGRLFGNGWNLDLCNQIYYDEHNSEMVDLICSSGERIVFHQTGSTSQYTYYSAKNNMTLIYPYKSKGVSYFRLEIGTDEYILFEDLYYRASRYYNKRIKQGVDLIWEENKLVELKSINRSYKMLFNYNENGLLDEIIGSSSNNSMIDKINYVYDNKKNLLSVIRTNKSNESKDIYKFNYNNVNLLTGITNFNTNTYTNICYNSKRKVTRIQDSKFKGTTKKINASTYFYYLNNRTIVEKSNENVMEFHYSDDSLISTFFKEYPFSSKYYSLEKEKGIISAGTNSNVIINDKSGYNNISIEKIICDRKGEENICNFVLTTYIKALTSLRKATMKLKYSDGNNNKEEIVVLNDIPRQTITKVGFPIEVRKSCKEITNVKLDIYDENMSQIDYYSSFVEISPSEKTYLIASQGKQKYDESEFKYLHVCDTNNMILKTIDYKSKIVTYAEIIDFAKAIVGKKFSGVHYRFYYNNGIDCVWKARNLILETDDGTKIPLIKTNEMFPITFITMSKDNGLSSEIENYFF